MSVLVLLGIDPGFATCGYAMADLPLADPTNPRVVEMGAIATEKLSKKRGVRETDDNHRRHGELFDELAPRVQGAHVVCIEAMSLPQNKNTAALIGLAYGTIYTLCRVYDKPLLMVDTRDAKEEVAGKKTASKAEVAVALQARLGIDEESMLGHLAAGARNHAYDALAALVACLKGETVRLLRSAMQ